MDFYVSFPTWPPQSIPSYSWNISLKQNCKDENDSTEKLSLVLRVMGIIHKEKSKCFSSRALLSLIWGSFPNFFPWSPPSHGLLSKMWIASIALSQHPWFHVWTMATYHNFSVLRCHSYLEQKQNVFQNSNENTMPVATPVVHVGMGTMMTVLLAA